MDIQQILRYSVSGASLSHESSGDNAPVCSEWMYGSVKFELRNTVRSPLSQCSSENLSQISPCGSAVGYNSSFHQISPSPIRFSDGLQFSSGSHDQSSIQSMRSALRKIETALMGPDADDEGVHDTTCDTSSGNNQMEILNRLLGSYGHQLVQDSEIQPTLSLSSRTQNSSPFCLQLFTLEDVFNHARREKNHV